MIMFRSEGVLIVFTCLNLAFASVINERSGYLNCAGVELDQYAEPVHGMAIYADMCKIRGARGDIARCQASCLSSHDVTGTEPRIAWFACRKGEWKIMTKRSTPCVTDSVLEDVDCGYTRLSTFLQVYMFHVAENCRKGSNKGWVCDTHCDGDDRSTSSKVKYVCKNGQWKQTTQSIKVCEDPSLCFPDDVMFQKKVDGSWQDVASQNLAIGDIIKCVDKETGALSECQLYEHRHAAPLAESMSYVNITHQDGYLVMSPDHFIYKYNAGSVPSGPISILPNTDDSGLTPARTINGGDLIAVEASDNKFAIVQVESVSTISLDTAHAPQITKGSLPIVNGIVASGYSITKFPMQFLSRFPPKLHSTLIAAVEQQASPMVKHALTVEFRQGLGPDREDWGLTSLDPAYRAWKDPINDAQNPLWGAIIQKFAQGFSIDAAALTSDIFQQEDQGHIFTVQELITITMSHMTK